MLITKVLALRSLLFK